LFTERVARTERRGARGAAAAPGMTHAEHAACMFEVDEKIEPRGVL
tara:strand:+ start:1033 stop:1170 length:138 start_codon:yes stop_codon:yes gene_type:complete